MGKVVKAIAAVGLITLGLATGGIAFIGPLAFLGTVSAGTLLTLGVTLGFSLLAETFLAPKIPDTQLSRLNVSMDADAPRKMVFGTTAFPLDLRYHEGTGTDQEFIHYVIAHAAHKVKSIDSIYFEQDLAWSSGGGVTSKYSGYLTVTTRTEGAAGNEVSISGNWGTGERLTGCAYTYIRIKRTGNSKKAESPLVSGLPSRVTVIGEGIPLYDPRLDSTVPGGSGSHRSDDQSTWGVGYTPADSHDNPALQLLAFLLGWKINGKLSVGCGVPVGRIDLPSFIEAANVCDEDISLSAGGTQDRYRTSGTCSDADDRRDIINALLACMNATLRDNNGTLSVKVLKNDLANYVLDLDDNDVLEGYQWDQTPPLSETYNVARGRYVDPSVNSLYQLVDYPEVSIASPDGIERALQLNLPYVEEPRRAQRIAKQVLQRNQYRGTFSGTFTAKALGCDIGEVIRLSFEPLGFSEKLFRVISKEIRQDGTVPLSLIEENEAIYAWDQEEGAAVTATAPTVYDPLNSPFILAAEEAGTTADWPSVTDSLNTKPEDNATVGAKAGTNLVDSADNPLGDADVRNIDQLYSDVTGVPTALGDINVTEGTKLTGIETGATAGATWDSNITGQPTNLLEFDAAASNDLAQVIFTANNGAKIFRQETEPTPGVYQSGDTTNSPSLDLNFTSSFGDGDLWIKPDSSQALVWDTTLVPPDWRTEAVLDLTKAISGDPTITLSYSSAGALQTATPVYRNYKIAAAGSATALTSGVTWAVETVLVGTQADSDIWSGASPSIQGTGTGVLLINSGLKVSSATLNITATVGGLSYGPFQVIVSKTTETASASNTTQDVASIANVIVNGSTFTTIAELSLFTDLGSTEVDLTANSISFRCRDNAPYVASNMQFKWQYESAPSTWTDVGSAADSNPDPFTINEGGFYESTFGAITCDRTQSSLTANTSYNFRLQARISSGETSKDFQIDLGQSVSGQG